MNCVLLDHHFMANRWRNSGNSGWFIFLGSKITADGDCSHEIKRRLLLGRKVMTNLDSILKSRDYFVNKGPSSQGYGFSSSHVWMWELDYKESWMPKNWRFWTVVLEKTLESPLDCKEIQPVHPKEISPGCSLERLMLKLKLQYFGHLMRRADSFEKTLMLGKIEGRRRRGDRGWDGWMVSPTQWTWVWVDSGSCWWTGRPGVLWFMGSQGRTQLSDWTELNWCPPMHFFLLPLFSGKCKLIFLYLMHPLSSYRQVFDHSKYLLKTVLKGFPGSPVVKNPSCNVWDTLVQSLVQEDLICLGATKLCATTTGHSGTHESQLLKPMGPRVHAWSQGRPPQWEAHTPEVESSPCCLQLEKACVQQWQP